VGIVVQALENIHREKMGRGSTASQYDENIVAPVLRKSISVYEAARVLMGYITPGYDEISQVLSSPSAEEVHLHLLLAACLLPTWRPPERQHPAIETWGCCT